MQLGRTRFVAELRPSRAESRMRDVHREPHMRGSVMNAPIVRDHRDDPQPSTGAVLGTALTNGVLKTATLVDHFAAEALAYELSAKPNGSASVQHRITNQLRDRDLHVGQPFARQDVTESGAYLCARDTGRAAVRREIDEKRNLTILTLFAHSPVSLGRSNADTRCRVTPKRSAMVSIVIPSR